jgi:glucose/arabinose dehydrogenase
MAALLAVVLVAIGYSAYTSSNKPNAPTTSDTNANPESPKSGSPTIKLTQYTTGLKSPTAIVSTKSSTERRLFVVERSGTIRIIGNNGSLESEPFLDISSKVLSNEEMGLLGLVFSPTYASDGYFFVNYIDKSQNTVIARYRLSSNENVADTNSEQILLTIKQPYANHNGGDLLFGKDGYLYVALGDGGSAGDPQNLSQNLNSLLGKILRIDVSQIPYKIPSSNPYYGQADKRNEIWSFGLRNPWRASFDRKTGDLYIADVGQGSKEEVNIEAFGSKGGANYGWRCYEGNSDFKTAGCGPKNQYVFPAFEYDHNNERCSITGGYVYRGQQYPALDGKYFYGDYCTGEIFWAEKQGDEWKTTKALDTDFMISTFGEDSRGELYAADFEKGTLYKLEASAN